MAHKTLIGGTAYNIVGGTTLISGTSYRIPAGKTLIGGTAYSIALSPSTPYTLDDWPGWDNATWEDINNLCYAKQQGYIDSWPSDVVLGAEKTVNLSEVVAGDTSRNCLIIGLDIDGNSTITFTTKDLSTSAIASSIYAYSNMYWGQSMDARRPLCQTFYNACENKDYILPITKGTCLTYNSSTVTYQTETVFLLSSDEIGYTNSYKVLGSEYTQGVSAKYPYFTDASKWMIPETSSSTKGYWLRSGSSYTSNQFIVVFSWSGSNYGSRNTADTSAYNLYFKPAFVIGNPEAQTIE